MAIYKDPEHIENVGSLENLNNSKRVKNIMMMEMVEADGDKDKNEVAIWYAVVKRLGIEHLYKR